MLNGFQPGFSIIGHQTVPGDKFEVLQNFSRSFSRMKSAGSPGLKQAHIELIVDTRD